MVGPKVPGTTNRGRKKTISLEQNALLGAAHNANGRVGGGGGAGSGNGSSSGISASGGGGDSLANDGAASAKRSRLVSESKCFCGKNSFGNRNLISRTLITRLSRVTESR